MPRHVITIPVLIKYHSTGEDIVYGTDVQVGLGKKRQDSGRGNGVM